LISHILKFNNSEILINPAYANKHAQMVRSSLYPVRNLELYLEWLGCCQNSECYLFPNLVKFQQGYIFRQVNKSLSYSRMRELFIEAFSPFVVNKN
jgi:hypothetical protein